MRVLAARLFGETTCTWPTCPSKGMKKRLAEAFHEMSRQRVSSTVSCCLWNVVQQKERENVDNVDNIAVTLAQRQGVGRGTNTAVRPQQTLHSDQ